MRSALKGNSFKLIYKGQCDVHCNPFLLNYTVLRARIIFLKYVHPAERARAQKLYIVSSYTYDFDETFTCVWIILWCISLEWHEAYLDDGFTHIIPPPRLLPDIQMIEMFFKPASHWLASRALIGRYGPWLGDTWRGDQCCHISASLHGRLYLWLCWYMMGIDGPRPS